MWNTLNKLVTTTNVTTTDITTTNVMDKEPDNGEEAFYEVVGEPIYNNVGKPAKENIVTPLTEWIGNLIIENPLLFFFVVFVLSAVVLFVIKLIRKKHPSTDPIGSITSKTESSSLSAYIRKHPLKQTSNYNNFLDYCFTGIGFYGRDTEMSSIHTFMSPKQGESEKVRFSILTITGKGGSGKSRIAFHTALLYGSYKYSFKQLCKQLCKYKSYRYSLIQRLLQRLKYIFGQLKYFLKKKWEILWIYDNSIKEIKEYCDKRIPKRLLIVCDYADSRISELVDFLKELRNKSRHSYIRVILLARTYNPLKDSSLDDEFKRLCIDPILLQNTPITDTDIISDILNDLLKYKRKSLGNERYINDILVYDNGTDDEIKNKVSKESLSAIFILLYADAVLEDKLNFDKDMGNSLKLNPDVIIKKLIIRLEERWISSKINDNVKISALNLVALSTMIGKFTFDNKNYGDCRDEYLGCIYGNYGDDMGPLRSLFNSINSDDTMNLHNYVFPMTPDLLGEFHAVYRYSNLNQEDKTKWLNIFLNSNYSQNAKRFIKRLFNDWSNAEQTEIFANECSNKILDLIKNTSEADRQGMNDIFDAIVEFYSNIGQASTAHDFRERLNNLENDPLTV